MKFLGNFSEGFFGGFFLDKFFGRIFLEELLGGFFWEEFFVYIGIDLFVKILVFVKILSKVTKKKNFRSLVVRLQVHRT